MSGTVLIVHDDLGVRRCLGEFLATKGYKVLSTSSGQEALGVLEEDLPRLLVIDVGLPLMSGWKLIEALAHYPDLSGIPRLLVNETDVPALLCGRALAILEPRERVDANGAVESDGTPAPADIRSRPANA
jgi:CheY-like chemotaxis protein